MFTWPQLTRAGVALEQEQWPLLLPPAAHLTYVMCVLALPDPFDEARTRMLYPPRLKVFDNPKSLRGRTVVVPMFGQVDCSTSAIDMCTGNYGPHWSRYPSVPVQLYDSRHPGEYRLWPDMMRLWNAWPVEVFDLDEINAAAMAALDWWDRLYEVAQVHFNDIDVCELVHGAGEHRHVPHPTYGAGSVMCATGEAYLGKLRDRFLWTGDVHQVRRPPDLLVEPAFYSARLERAWRSLCQSSARNTTAALDVVPPWDVAELVSIEKEHTPWL